MYKLIACDLDGTLLGRDRRVSKENIRSIQEAQKAGVIFVPDSGRGYLSVQDTSKEIGTFNRKNQYVISFNGGAITENYHNRLLHLDYLGYEKASRLFDFGVKRGLTLYAFTLKEAFIYSLDEDEKRFIKGILKYHVLKEPDISFLKGQNILKVLFESPDYSYLQSLCGPLEKEVPDLNISYSSDRYMEFNSSTASKGAGMKVLADYLGIPLKETIAIGDSLNDLSMIKEAGLGVGVANACEELKRRCGYITKQNCQQNAIKEVIDKFIFNR